MASSSAKKHIQIDISADTVCPWCFVGKKNLDKAIALSDDKYTFEIKWHPYMLMPSAPKEGVVKKEFYLKKFGQGAVQMEARMTEIFKGLGMDYDTYGLTGNSLDSHRLIHLAGKQGLDKQHQLVEQLSLGYFTRGKYIGDRGFLIETAKKVGVEGATEFLEDPNNGLKEVNEDLKKYSSQITGVPHFVINGKHKLSGGQPPEGFLKAFEAAAGA
ncbi:hypothetical protein OROGR_023577 [Orobanche gracilis]